MFQNINFVCHLKLQTQKFDINYRMNKLITNVISYTYSINFPVL